MTSALWDKAGLTAALTEAGVPAGPINTVAEALSDPQIEARAMAVAPEGIKGLRTPLKFSRSPLALDLAAPRLGSAPMGWGTETD